MFNSIYFDIWISYATDCLAYDFEYAHELYSEHDGKFDKFLTPGEIKMMFEYSEMALPNKFKVS